MTDDRPRPGSVAITGPRSGKHQVIGINGAFGGIFCGESWTLSQGLLLRFGQAEPLAPRRRERRSRTAVPRANALGQPQCGGQHDPDDGAGGAMDVAPMHVITKP